jgi:hypothetical protein
MDDHFQDLDPTVAVTREDFARCLRRLRVRADNISYRNLEKWGERNGRPLPRTTLSDVLNGRRFPRKSTLQAFLLGCGLGDDTIRAWLAVWARLAEQEQEHADSTPKARPRIDEVFATAESGRSVEVNSNESAPTRQSLFSGPSQKPSESMLQSSSNPRHALDASNSIWNIEPRNPCFVGRADTLARLREQLCANGRVAAQALRGMGGVGKTQLAIEYAYRYAEHYDVVWWVNSEQPGLIGGQYAALGVRLGILDPATRHTDPAVVVKEHLRVRDRWLVIFDNAETPTDIRHWIPSGAGHVIITSRTRRWTEVAVTVDVDVMPRKESVELLRLSHPELTKAESNILAGELGDLPLALSQAAGFLAESGTQVNDYLDLLATNATDALSEGTPATYPVSLAAAVTISIDRLSRIDLVLQPGFVT